MALKDLFGTTTKLTYNQFLSFEKDAFYCPPPRLQGRVSIPVAPISFRMEVFEAESEYHDKYANVSLRGVILLENLPSGVIINVETKIRIDGVDYNVRERRIDSSETLLTVILSRAGDR